MAWGIADTASQIERIRAESSDYLGGLNSVGEIDYTTYSELWDFYHDLLGKAYEQGLKDAPNNKSKEAEPVKHGHWIIEDIITYERSYGGTLYEPVYKCSCCGRVTESYVRGDEPIMPEDADFPEFCGNCGAKMDEMKVNNSKGIDLWMTKEDFNSLYEDDVEDGV